jgi:hypothetical protein
MIIIPREKPVIEGLNSYYLHIEKLVEHYQGEVGTGSIYFRSLSAEAAVFFDEDNLLNSCYHDKKEELKGEDALDKIIENASANNFFVSIYHILPEQVYFWANLSNAAALYTDLTSDFTDLEALIVKMEAERLTGYIEVGLNQEAGGGLLFFYNGEVIGGSSGGSGGLLDRSVEYRDDLIERSRRAGGRFNVRKIVLEKISTISKPISASELASASNPAPRPPEPEPRQPDRDLKRILEMLQALLSLSERVVNSNRKIKTDFENLLKQKFVEKADKYDFLDPFAGEFQYANGKLTFSGKASQKQLVISVVECVSEIIDGLGMIASFRKYFESWKKGFAEEIVDFDIEI